MKAAGFQRHKRPHLEHDLHGEDGSEDIIGVTEYLQAKETSVSGDSGVLASVWACRADTRAIVSLTMFLKEWDLIGSSAASEMLLRMMKMRMKLVK